MWILNIFKRLMRIPLAVIGLAIMIALVVTYPVWFVLFGADFEDVTNFGSDVFNFFMDVTDPSYDWNYVPPPPDNLGW
jgi:hypothetical protein